MVTPDFEMLTNQAETRKIPSPALLFSLGPGDNNGAPFLGEECMTHTQGHVTAGNIHVNPWHLEKPEINTENVKQNPKEISVSLPDFFLLTMREIWD